MPRLLASSLACRRCACSLHCSLPPGSRGTIPALPRPRPPLPAMKFAGPAYPRQAVGKLQPPRDDRCLMRCRASFPRIACCRCGPRAPPYGARQPAARCLSVAHNVRQFSRGRFAGEVAPRPCAPPFRAKHAGMTRPEDGTSAILGSCSQSAVRQSQPVLAMKIFCPPGGPSLHRQASRRPNFDRSSLSACSRCQPFLVPNAV